MLTDVIDMMDVHDDLNPCTADTRVNGAPMSTAEYDGANRSRRYRLT